MTIKVISLNMWQGGNLIPAILNFLAEQNADVVALQEVYDGQATDLADKYRSITVLKSLNYPFTDYAPAYMDDRPEGLIPQGNAILSKFPVKSRGTTFLFEPRQPSYKELPANFPILPRILQYVSLETPAGELNVFNLHGVWDIDGDNDSPDRRRMCQIVAEAATDKPHAIVTGDTNAKTTNPALRLLEKSLDSVFGQELTTTFNMRRKRNPGYAVSAVDHMYVSRDIKVLERSCPDIDISDHLPLIVSLKLE